ncbi:MAG: hypothetical protein HY895_23690 [Deltaproteobacteria bacterium]|nr:hypothetical protein [Deltaproteobacteria bacterium]
MSNTSKLDTLSSELESRLDELFREDAAPPAVPAPPAMTPDNPLGELKKTLLSIDWEITPETLDSFQDHIRLLKETFQRDKIISMLLQILGSLGQYIKASRSNVHPSTFMVLNSVFARLEEIVTSPGMPAPVRKKLLQAEMTGYQELRDKILKRRAAAQPSPAGKATGSAPAPVTPAPGAAAPPETLAQAMEELKAFIRSELKTLKEELKISARRP